MGQVGREPTTVDAESAGALLAAPLSSVLLSSVLLSSVLLGPVLVAVSYPSSPPITARSFRVTTRT